jgi:hypothetical protein
MTYSISFKISHKKDVTCLRHSVFFSASPQRIKIPVRPGHPGGRCYKILRAYGSGFPFKLNGTNHRGQGTGLGLPFSYDIVKAHGGELRMETTEGEGSEFIISIMDK